MKLKIELSGRTSQDVLIEISASVKTPNKEWTRAEVQSKTEDVRNRLYRVLMDYDCSVKDIKVKT